jgi:hypothetical protein
MRPSRSAHRLAGVAVAVMAASGFAASASAKTSPYHVAGWYVEGCSCEGVCPCELTGLKNGCAGVGAYQFTSGRYMGTNLAGARFAYALVPGDWLRLYVDARNPSQAKAAKALASSLMKELGRIESVKDAKVSMTGSGGRYSVSVDGGKTMKFSSAPVMGGDKRTPIVHSNIKNPLNPTVYQGVTKACTYRDGSRKIDLQGTNAYFNAHIRASGRA